MVVKFYRNKSDERVLTKTLDSEYTLSNVKLLEVTDILHPKLKVKSAAGVLTTYNYMYIPDYGRYYFIEELTADNGYSYVTARVDVLMSHAAALKNCSCIAERQQSEYNFYLNDEQFKTLQYDKQFQHNFTSPFSKSGSYILVVQGSGNYD